MEKMWRNFAEWRVTTRNWYQETHYARVYNKNRIQGETNGYDLSRILLTLGTCTRRCMDPVDYVYGVLGIFQFEIPRMDDPDAVWKLFLSKIDIWWGPSRRKNSRFSFIITNRAYQVDLRKAKDMADVYKNSFKLTLKTRI